MATSTRPAAGTAKWPSSMGGVLGQRNATLSPFPSPESRRREARRSTLLLQRAGGVASPAVDDGGLLGEHVGAAPEEADRRKLAAVDLLHARAPSLLNLIPVPLDSISSS